MGIEYVTHAIQVSLSGQLDIEGLHVGRTWDFPPAGLDECETCHVDAARALRQGQGGIQSHRLRVFADIFLGDHVYSLVELRADRGLETFTSRTRRRIEQAFARVSTASSSAGLQFGRFASPVGSYAMRHLTVVDPFVAPPLMYDYRTVANRWRVPDAAAALLDWKDAPVHPDRPGAPPLWDVPYQWGGMAFATVGFVDLRVAAMNGAPSSHPNGWKLLPRGFGRPSLVVSGRWRPTADLDLGVSYDRGPWMEATIEGTIGPQPGAPPGASVPHWSDFDQEVLTADVAYARGSTMIRVEGVFDRWQMPNVEDTPTELGLNVEIQRDFAAGFYLAGRGGYLDFRPLADGLGGASPLPGGRADWDYDVGRVEGAIGYRLTRNAGVMASAYRQLQDAAVDGDRTFVGVRLWWGF